jgi:ABC-type nickel/cobalt efflux system permease component RcnA
MDLIQTIILTVAISGPVIILVGVGRAVMCFDRSIRAKHKKSALLAALCIATLLALLAAILVVWFGYGVAHTGKDASTDLMVIAGTVIPSYVGVYLVWRASLFLENRVLENRHGRGEKAGR